MSINREKDMPYVPKPKAEKERRVPVQARSIARVNNILDTASELMANAENEKVTTHLIAEKAGVSVGSVYQFFPNVESIKIALIERLLDQYYQHFDNTISSNPNINDLSEITALLVDATHDFYQEHPEIVGHIVSSSHSEEFLRVNSALNARVRDRMVSHFRNKDYGLSEDTLKRKVSVAIAIGDAMTMFIWSAESEQEREAYLNDWKHITASYSEFNTN